MKVKDFVKGYKTAKEKAVYCEKHITKKYIPYAEKISIATVNIVEPTCHKEVDEQKIFWRNTPLQAMFFSLKLVEIYSDIEFSTENLFNDYDALVEVGALSDIIACIPSNEVDEFNTVVRMVDADVEYNERNLTSWLDGKIQTLGSSFETLMSGIAEKLMSQEEVVSENA